MLPQLLSPILLLLLPLPILLCLPPLRFQTLQALLLFLPPAPPRRPLLSHPPHSLICHARLTRLCLRMQLCSSPGKCSRARVLGLGQGTICTHTSHSLMVAVVAHMHGGT